MTHYTHPTLLERFDVALIGAGGSGSQMLICLARLHHAMVALGHPGFNVTVFDPDTVSEANIGRQMFSPVDVGQAKADVLTYRVNVFFGLAWNARAERFGAHTGRFDAEVLNIVCVDNRAARREIRQHVTAATARNGLSYVMDLGNRASDGQVILGQIGRHRNTTPRAAGHVDLPDPYTLLPALVTTKGREDTAPSCSLAEALQRQELFVNDDVVRAGAVILWTLLRRGQIDWHGAFVNCGTGRRTPIAVDPAGWERMRECVK
jgi:PRTRC genetic system ThiF family protein